MGEVSVGGFTGSYSQTCGWTGLHASMDVSTQYGLEEMAPTIWTMKYPERRIPVE